nr:hypothetical protein [Tanacetum cinerariifolium]
MDTTIDQQVAMDEDLVPTAQRLKIGRSNFRLLSDIKSKESTLQLVCDVLRICPFFKAFLILHICPRVHGQSFAEPPFEEEILAFICFLGHSEAVRTLTDVNINKLYQPWRSFSAIINKCLTGKSFGYDSLRLSQAQILWGLYHKRNVDYAYLMWEDSVYQVKHKNKKKSNEMRNKVNWHYVRDDHMFSIIKLAYKEYYAIAIGEAAPKPKASVRRTRSSSHTSIITPTATAAMTEALQLKLVTKRSMQQTHISQPSGSGDDNEEKDDDGDEEDEGEEGNSDDDDEDDDGDEGDGDDDDQEVERDDDKDDKDEGHIEEEQEDELYIDVNINQGRGLQMTLDVEDSHVTLTLVHPNGQHQSSLVSSQFVTSDDNEEKDDDGDEEDEGEEGNSDDDDEDDDGDEGDGDDDDQEVERDDDKDDKDEGGDDDQEYDNEYAEETRDEKSFDHIPQTPESSDNEGNGEEDLGLNVGGEEGHIEEEQEDELYIDVNINQGRGLQMTLDVEDSHALTTVAPLPLSKPTLSPSTIATVTIVQQAPTPLTTAPSTLLQNLPNFGSLFGFDHRLKTLEDNFSEFVQTNQFAEAVSSVLEITVNEQLKAEVLTQSSNSSKTSYVIAADLSEIELKKILIEKMKGNKSIHRSNEQRDLYKALVEAYESDKIILDTYGDTITLKRRHDDDADKDEEPSAG